MAPALVEHSSSKERNSISKTYFKLSCMSHLDIDLVEKFRHTTVDSPTGLFVPTLDRKNKKDKSNIEEGMLPNDTEQKPAATELKLVRNKNGITSKCYDCINPTIPNFQNENGHIDDVSSKGILSSPISTSPVISTSTPTLVVSPDISTNDSRGVQPVAKYTLTKNISDTLSKKHSSVHTKLYDLNQDINKLSTRLQNLQKSNLMSHVACFVTQNDQISKESNIKIENDTKSADLRNNRNTTDVTVKNCVHENNVKNISLYNPLRKLYDLTINNDVTDDDELESKVRIPLRGKRQKCEQ